MVLLQRILRRRHSVHAAEGRSAEFMATDGAGRGADSNWAADSARPALGEIVGCAMVAKGGSGEQTGGQTDRQTDEVERQRVPATRAVAPGRCAGGSGLGGPCWPSASDRLGRRRH